MLVLEEEKITCKKVYFRVSGIDLRVNVQDIFYSRITRFTCKRIRNISMRITTDNDSPDTFYVLHNILIKSSVYTLSNKMHIFSYRNL